MSKEIGKRKVEVHKMEGLYPCVRLEDFKQVVKQLEEENRKLKKRIKEHCPTQTLVNYRQRFEK